MLLRKTYSYTSTWAGRDSEKDAVQFKGPVESIWTEFLSIVDSNHGIDYFLVPIGNGRKTAL
jgi:hypothetical protein